MKIEHEIRTSIVSDIISLDDIRVGDEKFTLRIENMGEIIFLAFMKGELIAHEIIISPDGIQQQRLVLKPSHDHHDRETLTKTLEWKALGWDEVEEYALRIPFGMRVDIAG